MSDHGAAEFWELVNRERALRGWSWTTLESRSGVRRSTMAKWRTGRSAPTAQTITQVADALGIERLDALYVAGVLEPPPGWTPPGLAGLAGLARRVRDERDRQAREPGERRTGTS